MTLASQFNQFIRPNRSNYDSSWLNEWSSRGCGKARLDPPENLLAGKSNHSSWWVEHTSSSQNLRHPTNVCHL